MSREQLRGRHILAISPKLEGTEQMQSLIKAMQGETVYVSKRSSPSRPDLYVDSYLVPLKINGQITGVILMARDVSNLVQAERMLESTNQELESFSYSVSHDLRAPLRAISGYANILEEDYAPVLDNEGKRLLFVIQRNAVKMGELIDDLLNFSRLGKKELAKALVNNNELVQAVVTQLQEDGATTTNFIIDELHPAIADAALLAQVWYNLLSNAVKYSGTKDKPTVEVSSRHEGDTVVFLVRDNGVGFDQRYASKLFGVFQRLHGSGEFPGTGVGLAIVKRIVHKHGGRVWAEAALNQGARFYFSIPNS